MSRTRTRTARDLVQAACVLAAFAWVAWVVAGGGWAVIKHAMGVG